MNPEQRKRTGAFYTPDPVVASLVKWAARTRSDRLLDPACGDGRFLGAHRKSVGVEQDLTAHAEATKRAPWALIHEGDFFRWASATKERFDCAAGNPPFIRYQQFAGEIRERALALCRRKGVEFNSLSSSWAPFLAATASLLRPGGRMAFVVPAEIGHAPYARPLLKFFSSHFSLVQLIAVRNKLFPGLSEDCWLLYAEGFGGATGSITLTPLDTFTFRERPPTSGTRIPIHELEAWNWRLRPFLLPSTVRAFYSQSAASHAFVRLGEVAKVGIGYVTGDNDFFHLRPSQASSLRIPAALLHATVRNGRLLRGRALTCATVDAWRRQDAPMLLLRLGKSMRLPRSVENYLSSGEAERARGSYKCRNRDPWYAVPDVSVPDAFLSYMSGLSPTLVANQAECVCTNSVHAVRLTASISTGELLRAWQNPLTALSCEIEGHPLGGGVLKIEPGEAARILLSRTRSRDRSTETLVEQGVRTLREWRHCA